MSQFEVIRNKAGQVAIMHYQPVTIAMAAGAKQYTFNYRNNVAMAWVDPDDVNIILSKKKQCCGGNFRPIFQYCNRQQVNIWITGDPRKDFENG